MINDADIHLDSVWAMVAEVNIPSNFFPAESYLIDNIITSTPRFATLERSPWDQFIRRMTPVFVCPQLMLP